MKDSRPLNSIFSSSVAMVAILATVFVVLVSGMFLAENANHHCNDEAHCPVCSLIVQCEKNIKTIGSGLIIALVAAMVSVTVAESTAHFEYQSVQTTLVSQKVRLDS